MDGPLDAVTTRTLGRHQLVMCGTYEAPYGAASIRRNTADADRDLLATDASYSRGIADDRRCPPHRLCRFRSGYVGDHHGKRVAPNPSGGRTSADARQHRRDRFEHLVAAIPPVRQVELSEAVYINERERQASFETVGAFKFVLKNGRQCMPIRRVEQVMDHTCAWPELALASGVVERPLAHGLDVLTLLRSRLVERVERGGRECVESPAPFPCDVNWKG